MGYFPLRFEHWRISFRRFQPGAMDVYSKMARGWVGTAPAKYMQRSFEDWLAIFGLGFQWSLRFQGKKIDCLVSISSVGTLVRLLLLYNNQSWILLSEVGFSNSFLLMSSCLPQIFVVFSFNPALFDTYSTGQPGPMATSVAGREGFPVHICLTKVWETQQNPPLWSFWSAWHILYSAVFFTY